MLQCLDCYSFIVWFAMRKMAASFKFSKTASAVRVFFFVCVWFHTNFRIIYSNSVENIIVILIGLELNLRLPWGVAF